MYSFIRNNCVRVFQGVNMKDNKTSEAQIKASRNWEKNNPEKARYGSYKRTARLFIRKYAEKEDLQELEELIKIRRDNIC